jgi:hypothetical protein
MCSRRLRPCDDPQRGTRTTLSCASEGGPVQCDSSVQCSLTDGAAVVVDRRVQIPRWSGPIRPPTYYVLAATGVGALASGFRPMQRQPAESPHVPHAVSS